MRRSTTLLAAVAIAFLAGSALTQPPGGGRGGMFQMRGTGGAMLAMNASVQEELKLSGDQKDKLAEVAKMQRDKMQEMFAKLREEGGQIDREKMQEAMKEVSEAATKAIDSTLSADQKKRLKQITWQQGGVAAFSDDEVAKSLKITDEQKDKFKSIADEMQADMREIFQSAQGNRDEMTQKTAALRKETMEKAQNVLTADQKTQYKEMLGKPFELKQDPNAGGFGGGKGGNRKKGDRKKIDD